MLSKANGYVHCIYLYIAMVSVTSAVNGNSFLAGTWRSPLK